MMINLNEMNCSNYVKFLHNLWAYLDSCSKRWKLSYYFSIGNNQITFQLEISDYFSIDVYGQISIDVL
jgi:hypothetical protein